MLKNHYNNKKILITEATQKQKCFDWKMFWKYVRNSQKTAAMKSNSKKYSSKIHWSWSVLWTICQITFKKLCHQDIWVSEAVIWSFSAKRIFLKFLENSWGNMRLQRTLFKLLSSLRNSLLKRCGDGSRMLQHLRWSSLWQ